MLDAAMRTIIDPPLDRLGALLARIGVSADCVTLFALIPGAGAVWALAHQAYGLALALILVNRLCDGLDGAVARHSRLTDFGGYLDIVSDFIFYAAVLLGFLLADPDANAIAAAALMVSFFGTGSSFLAFATIAAKRGLSTEARGAKSFYYMGGLAEGTETILFFILACLAPQHFQWLAYGFAAICWITIAGRALQARALFRDD
ncbi:MAG: CDP-alcohol phosphatidyltransferase family protein [Marivibrio sp.]|uniref:CDP-alcohol phosphatidyltransferase family protein n=1 Tax=Marivibrio sp. TaxID=2039719 RepID=UPI0032EB70A5